jgi:hypothetical protein
MKYETSFSTLKQCGTDEKFYSGIDYCLLPGDVIEALSNWCQMNAGNSSLASRGANHDEDQEVYYVPLHNKEGRAQLGNLIDYLKPTILDALKVAIDKLSQDNFLAATANGHIDNASSLMEFRNALIRFREKHTKSTKTDAVLIIGGF